MELETAWIRIETDGGTMPAYSARPAAAKGKPLPGVVVLQEAWGVDAHIEDVSRRIAEAGYHALAPDLFAHKGERQPHMSKPRLAALKGFIDEHGTVVFGDEKAREAALAKKPEKEAAEIRESFGGLLALFGTQHEFLGAVRAAAKHLRKTSPGKKVGSIGFCMGGGLSGGLACSDPELAAAVAFYGTPPAAEQLDAIRASFLGLYGGPEKDARVTSAVPAFEKAMREKGKRIETVIYQDAQHAFFNDTRPSFDLDAARDAWARALALFARELV